MRLVPPGLFTALGLAVQPVPLSPLQMSEALNRIPDRIAGEPEDHHLTALASARAARTIKGCGEAVPWPKYQPLDRYVSRTPDRSSPYL